MPEDAEKIHRGLVGVYFDRTKTTYIDGKKGILEYSKNYPETVIGNRWQKLALLDFHLNLWVYGLNHLRTGKAGHCPV